MNCEKWTNAYFEGNRVFGCGVKDTALTRLTKFNLLSQERDTVILDLGSGNGIILDILKENGFKNPFGIELDLDLILSADLTLLKNHMVNGSIVMLPFKSQSVDICFINCVLHHLRCKNEYFDCLLEIKRILKNDGLLIFCEPIMTVWRKFFTVLLFSPFGSLFKFSRAKRMLIEEERDELNLWFENFNLVMEHIERLHFSPHMKQNKILKTYRIYMKGSHT